MVAGDLADDGSIFANSAPRVSHDLGEPKLTSKGFPWHRAFPQFVGDSETPDAVDGCLATCSRLRAILSAPANNRFSTTFRILANNNLTQNPVALSISC
jgi:hypothetical protein